MQKQYQERTTLRTWGVLQRALQVSQPGYSTLMWHHEHKPQEPQRSMAPLGHLGSTVTQRYDVSRDWLWDACHLARVCWGTRCKGFCSKEGLHYRIEQSMRNPLERDQVQRALGNCPEAVIGQATINLYSQVWKSLEEFLPRLTSSFTALLSGGLHHARK